MRRMSFLRRSILVPFLFTLIISGILAFGLSFLSLKFYPLGTGKLLGMGFGLMFIFSGAGFYITIHRPLRRIIHEMKALLTGKTYRRVLTAKTNELGVLAHFFNEVTRNLESISGSVQSHKRILKELDTAQEIQQLLIPKNAPVIANLEVTAKTRPASEIGGDTFDFYTKGNRNLFYIGDSTGHGIPAGIVMVMVDALLETFISLEDTLTNMVIKLNQYLKPHLKPTMFMTMILLEWVPSESKLKWIGAGHEYIVHVHTDESRIESIPAGGLAVGMIPDNSKLVHEKEIILKGNDFIVLYSDGIVEAKNVNGETYNLKRLEDFLKGHCAADTNTQTIFEQIAIDVGRFMEGQAQLDDMTLIVIKHTKTRQAIEGSTEWKN